MSCWLAVYVRSGTCMQNMRPTYQYNPTTSGTCRWCYITEQYSRGTWKSVKSMYIVHSVSSDSWANEALDHGTKYTAGIRNREVRIFVGRMKRGKKACLFVVESILNSTCVLHSGKFLRGSSFHGWVLCNNYFTSSILPNMCVSMTVCAPISMPILCAIFAVNQLTAKNPPWNLDSSQTFHPMVGSIKYGYCVDLDSSLFISTSQGVLR